jgi:hypothetical protein
MALLDRSVVVQKIFDFNRDGLAHIGMLPDLIADFRALGLTDADLSPLLNSAQGYIQVWKKAVVSGKVVGNLYHTIRFPASWQPWGNVSAVVQNNPGNIIGFTCASIGENLHVVAIGQNEELYHTIRFKDGSWQPWGNVSAVVQNNPGKFFRVACASIGENLHVVAIGQDGNLYHTIRFPASWQPWGNVSAVVQNNPGGQFGGISCARIG